MTRLTYLVGGEEIASYVKAVARSKELGARIIRRYEPVKDKCNVSAQLRNERVNAIKAKGTY